jgi:hypothetical protein
MYKVIDIPQLDYNGGDIRASFRSVDPTLNDDNGP